MANKYAGTQTEKNLREAFSGESQARNKYTYFASKAKKEGFEQISALFLKTADNEKEHAKMWFKELNGLGNTAENLASINVLVGYASIGIIVILLLVSIFLISNTITIGITVRKEEISIMKLIGATDFFVRTPFIVEGITIGFAGSVVPCVLLYFMYSMVIEFLTSNFSGITNLMTFLPRSEVFHVLTPVCLLIGIGIGFVGSVVTTRKHLKV